jgi:hypothetical protein
VACPRVNFTFTFYIIRLTILQFLIISSVPLSTIQDTTFIGLQTLLSTSSQIHCSIIVLQTHIRETSFHSIKPYLKQVFQSVYRYALEAKITQKPWKQEIAKIPDWPRSKAFAEFRLRVGHDCLGTHLQSIGIRPDPYCMLCSLREPMDRNHLWQCTALFNRTGCERYWETRAKITENWLCSFSIIIFCDYSLSLGHLY